MAKKTVDLSKVGNRTALKPRREPYWQKLANGQYLGFRLLTPASTGSWSARAYEPTTKKQLFQALGDFSHLQASERFGAASEAARKWFRHLDGGGSAEAITVGDACRQYAALHSEVEVRFKRYVYEDPIAKVPLQKLTEPLVRAWRARLASLPAVVSKKRDGTVTTRQRAAATLNRDMVPFRAALNMAQASGYVLSNLAWKRALEPAPANGRRNTYLDKSQRAALVGAIEAEDIRTFVHGLCLLPLRPGAMASLRVCDFDPRRGELLVHADKTGAGRRILLPKETITLFTELSKGQASDAPLFRRADGRKWDKDSWKGPIRKAAEQADLPDSVSAYTLRHSTITDLVQGGLDLLTIAQVSGTSVAMIEKHYGHLQGKRAAQALAALAI
jgi:integrase